MVALVMALGCYMNDDSSDSSTYDDRGYYLDLTFAISLIFVM
jgi:hypothetical protein